jgi:hypothetical protein
MDHNIQIRNLLAPFLPLELILDILYEFKAIETPSCRAVKNLIDKNHSCISIIPKRNMYISNNNNNNNNENSKYVYFGMNYENNILKVAQIMKQ